MTQRPALLAVVLGIVSPVMALSQDTDFSYFYFKDERPLLLDEHRVAVSGIAHGTLGEMEPWPIAPWTLVALPKSVDPRCVFSAEPSSEAFVSPIFYTAEGELAFPTRDILVAFSESTPDAEDRLSPYGTVLEVNWAGLSNAYRVRSHAGNGLEVLRQANELARFPEVRFAEPDMIFTGRGALFPTDPQFENAWGLHNTGQFGPVVDVDLNGPEAWDVTIGRPSISVLIIDTGVQSGHPDLVTSPGVDSTSDGPGPGTPVNDCDNHGTPVAGCVGAVLGNDIGTVGAAPGCTLVSARTFISLSACDSTWTTMTSWTVASLVWAEENGIRVTNNSNVYGFVSASITAKYDETRAAGMLHFAATGNQSRPSVGFPASVESVLAVSGIQPSSVIATLSNWGPETVFTGPAEEIYTTDRTGDLGWGPGSFVWAEGTSMASAYVSGAAALVLSVDPSLSPDEVESLLVATARDLGAPGEDDLYGAGLPDAAAAVEAARPEFIRGDANADGAVEISDVIHSLTYQFSDGDTGCLLAHDTNDDNVINVADVIFLLTALFTAGAPLPSTPFPTCGVDPGAALLVCDSFGPCSP